MMSQEWGILTRLCYDVTHWLQLDGCQVNSFPPKENKFPNWHPYCLVTDMRKIALTITLGSISFVSFTHAVKVAGEDFDGGSVNLTSSNVFNLDGGGGDAWGVGSVNNWFQSSGMPFNLADDSVASVGGPVFPTDLEGVFGQNSNFDNNFFGIADSDEFGVDQTASWTFDISGFLNLSMSIKMGGIADGDSFGGFDGQTLTFAYSIDGGASQTAFFVSSTTDIGDFSYRPMDSGNITPAVGVLEVTGDQSILKMFADSGLAAANNFIDKTPASGAGAGIMDTFFTDIIGTGSELTLTLTGDFPFEAMAFDDIEITGDAVPEPSTYAMIAGALMLGFAWLRRRK